jgi:hypothetical protein
MKNVEVAYILGAGFSSYAGLPLQRDFTASLLKGRDYKKGPSKDLVALIDIFIQDTFDHSKTAHARFWPELEDIFTCIDLSANTGHHLGENYAPSHLRMIRRALLSRINRMLHSEYERASKSRGLKWTQLKAFFNAIDPEKSAFVIMNWDTVVEARLEERYLGKVAFNYTGDSVAARFPATGDRIVERDVSDFSRVDLIKMHGSTNWLYCDNCRTLFWVPITDVLKVAEQAVSDDEWKKIREIVGGPEHAGWDWKCCHCKNVRLGGRIATFSYRKSLDFPMFQKSWFRAERALRRAKTWVFIGYSLPAADYEFKYFLKRIELSRSARPEYILVTYGDPGIENNTYRNYQRFFGRGIKIKENCFFSGIDKNVIARLKTIYSH